MFGIRQGQWLDEEMLFAYEGGDIFDIASKVVGVISPNFGGVELF